MSRTGKQQEGMAIGFAIAMALTFGRAYGESDSAADDNRLNEGDGEGQDQR